MLGLAPSSTDFELAARRMPKSPEEGLAAATEDGAAACAPPPVAVEASDCKASAETGAPLTADAF